MAREFSRSWIFMVFLWRPVLCRIIGPDKLTYFIGETAQFKWNTSDSSAILSATWGIQRGNIPDPQFIYVDILRNKANPNSLLEPNLMKRAAFEGDLKRGRAWFTLKNVTVNDTNAYIASISDDVTRVLPCTVTLIVKERHKKDAHIEPTKGIGTSRFPETDRKTSPKDAEHHQGTPQGNVTETEVHTPKDPKDPPVYSDTHKTLTICIAVTAAVVMLSVSLIIAYKYKRNLLNIKRRGTTLSEKKLMEGRVDI